MTPTQIQRQLETWRKSEEKAIYNELEQLARSEGILTKTGKISTSKKNEKRLKEFTRKYKQKYGSYSSFEKKQREKWKESIKDTGVNQTFREFKQQQRDEREYSKLINRLFEEFADSDSAREIFDYVEFLPVDEAIDYLLSVLNSNNQEYYGSDEDYEPPF